MLNFKELQEFKPVGDDAPTTTTNLTENKVWQQTTVYRLIENFDHENLFF